MENPYWLDTILFTPPSIIIVGPEDASFGRMMCWNGFCSPSFVYNVLYNVKAPLIGEDASYNLCRANELGPTYAYQYNFAQSLKLRDKENMSPQCVRAVKKANKSLHLMREFVKRSHAPM